MKRREYRSCGAVSFKACAPNAALTICLKYANLNTSTHGKIVPADAF